MRKFKMSAAQGEVYFLRVNNLPVGVTPVTPENGKFILAHSETGHHHVMEAKPNVQLFSTNNPLVSYLQVIEATDATEALLEHLRDFDTHQAISFDAGTYMVVNAREHTPEGWRRVAD